MALVHSGDGFLSLLKKRDFLRLWLAQLISMTILQASNYAMIILIEQKTNSTTLIGLAIISFSLPAVLFGAPAGVFVDRLDKRLVLWTSNCLRAIATFLFALILLTNNTGLIPIYLLTFLISTIGQFFTPAEGASIPMLVNEQELMPALSLFNITFMLSQALGFILLAPLALTLLPTLSFQGLVINSTIQLYLLIGVLYLICAALILSIPHAHLQQRLDAPAEKTRHASTWSIWATVWQEMSEGWRFVRRDTSLFLGVVQLSFAGVLILVIGQLATPIVTKLLLRDANTMPLVFAPAGIGLVAGSIFVPTLSRKLGTSRTILFGTLTLTVATVLLPVLTLLARFFNPAHWSTDPLLFILVACCMLVAGVALNLVNIPAQAIMQERSPDWIKGRVLALQLAFYNACSIPIILFIGAFADYFGMVKVLFILAASEILFGFWGFSYERRHSSSGTEDVQRGLSEEADQLSQPSRN
ncbi:MFS transporter [Tengunoibacter tsumagoiensis]|uniref:MFS transporter n=1 Tax=Tengunoibacter tsumagoiensis TaxID=2014871 RepID=A0A402A2S5_9CHLR|nr:MFS transporter [Tengunoibacter tsumagoiensis]GCE13372.1 MFS transporter [Tengunoibacter tsumagoiensis]